MDGTRGSEAMRLDLTTALILHAMLWLFILLLMAGVIHWFLAQTLRAVWHRANIEAVHQAVEDTVRFEAVCLDLESIRATIGRLEEEVAAVRGAWPDAGGAP